MEILNNFGIDPKLLGAQIVNFLIVLYLLRRFLYKPILDNLEKRKTLIKEGLDKTEEARIRLEKAEEQERQILQAAQAQAEKILEDAKKESLEVLQKTEEDARIKVENMLIQAREQIAFETKTAEKKLGLEVSRLAIDFLQNGVKNLFSKKEQELVMRNVLRKFKQ